MEIIDYVDALNNELNQTIFDRRFTVTELKILAIVILTMASIFIIINILILQYTTVQIFLVCHTVYSKYTFIFCIFTMMLLLRKEDQSSYSRLYK